MKKMLVVFALSLVVGMIFQTNTANAGTVTIYNKGDWAVYLHDPHGAAKPYHHLHFYKNGKHIYCLRLDNFQYCDGKKDRDKVPNSVYDKVMSHSKVKKAVKQYHPDADKGVVFNAVARVAAIGIGAILVVLAAFNVFTGPADDVVAWGFFLKALAGA